MNNYFNMSEVLNALIEEQMRLLNYYWVRSDEDNHGVEANVFNNANTIARLVDMKNIYDVDDDVSRNFNDLIIKIEHKMMEYADVDKNEPWNTAVSDRMNDLVSVYESISRSSYNYLVTKFE